jgi:prophage maintenance system killer protein
VGVLNLATIESALRDLQQVFPEINRGLLDRRDSLDDEVLLNMLEGYSLVDRLLTERIDLFEIGHSSTWLQLNATVLCGTDAGKLARHHRMLEATEDRFYEKPGAGIADVMNWFSLNQGKDVWRRAAGVYNRVLSEPQLFIEGNHRTGALIMSYILVREGKPPFVLTRESAQGYFDPSSVVKKTKKKSLMNAFKFRRLTQEFASFLKAHKDPRFIAHTKIYTKANL